MQISPAFVAVILLMVVLVVFVVIIIHSLAVAAGIRIRSDMLKMLQSYDRLLEKKSGEILRLQEEAETLTKKIEEAKALPTIPAANSTGARPAEAATIPPASSYRVAEFGSSYNAIRNFFRMSDAEKDEVLQLVQAENEQEGMLRGARAEQLKERLNFDLIFRMSQLNSDEQLELLDSSLEDEDWALLRDYCERSEGPFDITLFADWLSSIAALESSGVEILDSGSGSAVDSDGNAVICEGVQIFTGSKLYDYSIGEREIG